MNTNHSIVLTLIALLTGSVSWGVEVVATIQHTSEYTTNTARTADNEIEEWIHQPGIDLGVTHNGPNLDVNVGYSFERRFYEEDRFDNENATTGTANVLWHALPQRLDFVLSNSRTESTERALNIHTRDNRDNRQEVMITQLGPTLRFQPRSGDQLLIDYRYIDVRADRTDTDSVRHTDTARYVVGLSATRSLTISSSYTDVDFDNPLALDIESWTHSATYSQQGGALDFAITGGYSEFDRDQDRAPVDGGTFNVELTWQRGGSTLTLSGGIRRCPAERGAAIGAHLPRARTKTHANPAAVVDLHGNLANSAAACPRTAQCKGRVLLQRPDALASSRISAAGPTA